MLNDPEFVGATILVAGHNFGTGSSREHAVWALMDYGFQAVVVLALRRHLPQQLHQAGAAPGAGDRGARPRPARRGGRRPSLEITIDVARGTIEAPAAGLAGTFPLDEFTRERLLNGWDDIGLSLRYADDITAYERRRPDFLPSASS